jgi:sentrin-specific protease 1
VPITSRESVEKKSEEVRAQILASQTRKVEEFITSEEESNQLLQRINDEIANGVSESRSDMFGEEEEMEEEDDQNAGLIAARKMPLDCADVDEIRKLLQGRPNDPRLVMDKFNIDITVSKIVCLKPNTWLNDEIVNFYMCLLQERDDQLSAASNGARKRSHYFNSFFITKLLENGTYNYGNVKRWTKKFDVFAMDRVFMPVNLSNTHWTLAVAYIQKKEIHYYDSMSGSGKRHMEAIRQWLVDEAREKKQMTLNPAEWKLVDREEHVPQQRNGYDCGVFSIICADYLSDSLPLEYTQEEMPDNRIKIAWAIREGKLWY